MFSKFVIQQEAGQIMIHVKNNPQYYINAMALTFSENDLGDPNRVAVSLVSGTVVMVHEKGIIDYASDGSYEKWTLRGYSTKLVKNDKYYIYARLSRADKTALIVFSANSYNLDGSITTITGKDEEGNDITETTDPNENYFYVKIGELTETDGSSVRELTYDSGLLGTDKGKYEAGEWNEMWEFSKLSTPWLIRAKQWLADFTVKGFIKLVGGLKFSKGQEGDEKPITDIKRTVDSDNEFILDENGYAILDEDGNPIKDPKFVPVSDETIPTTAWVEKQSSEKYLKKYEPDFTEHLIKFLDGIEVGESILDFANGKGTVITPNGLVQTDRMEVRGSAIFKEFIFNRIQAQEGDTSYSENGLVEECVLMDDGTYMLYLQKRWENDFTGFKEGDILYGDVNNLFSTGEYYTSWVRVLHVDTAANIITVIPYSDSQVPGGVNHAPETQMRLVRRGNAIDKTRQSYWYLSATDEKCFVWLEGVDKPIIEEYNYYVMIGRPKRLELFANLPIDYEQSYIFARGAIIEDLHRVNFEGKPIKQLNDRGFWSLETAHSDHPYTSTNEIADTVWHYGCRWQCLVTGTTQEPKFSASDWAMVEGNPTFVIDVNSTNNYVFDMDVISKLNSAGQYDVFTTLVVTGTLYNQDVTEHILDADCSWTRDTGDVTEDNAWAIKRASAGKELALTVEDLGTNYNMMRSCTFKVTVLLRDGQQFEMDIYEITF